MQNILTTGNSLVMDVRFKPGKEGYSRIIPSRSSCAQLTFHALLIKINLLLF
jgi:hypothetical protein